MGYLVKTIYEIKSAALIPFYTNQIEDAQVKNIEYFESPQNCDFEAHYG